MLDRLGAQLLIRQCVKQSQNRRKLLRAEHCMELIAEYLNEDTNSWATLGLMSLVDIEATEMNLDARGRIARQQAKAEGLPESDCEAIEHFRKYNESASILEHALAIAELLSSDEITCIDDLPCDLRVNLAFDTLQIDDEFITSLIRDITANLERIS